MSQSDFESMFKELAEGDVVIGTVVHIDKDGVLVDVGSKSEGVVRPNELSREPYDNIEDVVSINEQIKVVVIGRTEEGQLLLSKKRADFEKAWDKVIEAMNDGTILHAMVSERVKGGLVVDLGIRGFVPGLPCRLRRFQAPKLRQIRRPEHSAQSHRSRPRPPQSGSLESHGDGRRASEQKDDTLASSKKVKSARALFAA